MELPTPDPPELREELKKEKPKAHRFFNRSSAILVGVGVGRFFYDRYYSGDIAFGREALSLSLTIGLLLILGPFFMEMLIREDYHMRQRFRRDK
ncbi:hypothetical protein A2954_01235 [Candidatus Roizmanbacteria bacterium RIFCSPLOWO2_01_FULL_37_12]|uniref:TM2 domain-containing protein n=1 Tax=Candidatus Roizmanbacteria bacterium RIFCSPLOWO2_01_FULL_37_12 TaxID=1802056 RepID=A0A1F7IGH7_9BACT|nr:MAG: hypothetical protein A3D76_06055 [Candidatus Roizmanbacteria bacterium RIFCSPHIGHO2_02_FULL_37_9b]OGK42449.1 MAG: hypothetical protein A2954_01235 [Candidatus Roizmanbacteria bacterium RIFCSPLOWO2_01_FULL_37_12]